MMPLACSITGMHSSLPAAERARTAASGPALAGEDRSRCRASALARQDPGSPGLGQHLRALLPQLPVTGAGSCRLRPRSGQQAGKFRGGLGGAGIRRDPDRLGVMNRRPACR